MRITFSEELKAFLEDHGGVYPYSDMKVTRNSFHLEWILEECEWNRTQNILRMETQFIPVHVSCYRNKPKVLEKLLMEGSVYPLAEGMNEIMDAMCVWGQSVSYHWYSDTLQLLVNWIAQGHYVSKKEMWKEVIERLVLARIQFHYQFGSYTYAMLYNNWQTYFELTYMTRHKTFFMMAGMSRNYIESSIHSLNTHGSIVLAPYF